MFASHPHLQVVGKAEDRAFFALDPNPREFISDFLKKRFNDEDEKVWADAVTLPARTLNGKFSKFKVFVHNCTHSVVAESFREVNQVIAEAKHLKGCP